MVLRNASRIRFAKSVKRSRQSVALIVLYAVISSSAWAQNVPGPADAGRVIPATPSLPLTRSEERLVIPKEASPAEMTDDENAIRFKLQDVQLEGVTAISEQEIAVAYYTYYFHQVSLKDVNDIASNITRFYRDRGYFLTRAYVPEQEIDNGIVTIKVVEGYIGHVVLDKTWAEKPLIARLIQNILNEKPISAEKLEELVLRLNDLPGQHFRTILKPMPQGPEGATQLELIPEKTSAHAMFTSGNSGSRFLGPYINSVTLQDSLIDMQQTTLTLSASTQIDELRYGTLSHDIPLTPEWSLNLNGNYVIANPGYTLRQNDIQSSSVEAGSSLVYHYIRQWHKNLDFSLTFNGRNTTSTIFDLPLTRDRIRALRGSMYYNLIEDESISHAVNATISQGLDGLGSSKAGELNLSRGQAQPDFTKLEASYKQQRYLGSKILATGKIAGQYADAPLFSSEEFGYGGSNFGRAYDNSEITGDHGIATSVELGYSGLRYKYMSLMPFVFYDIGKVWNRDQGQKPQSASSAGFGIHIFGNKGINFDFTVAQPLTKDIDNPLNGNGKSPRYSFQLSIGI